MPRKLRMEFEGAIYHGMNRGDRHEPIFREDRDRNCFLETAGLDRALFYGGKSEDFRVTNGSRRRGVVLVDHSSIDIGPRSPLRFFYEIFEVGDRPEPVDRVECYLLVHSKGIEAARAGNVENAAATR